MAEDIKLLLDLAGVTLEFINFDLKGIPGFSTQVLSSLDSSYEIERQVFSFQVATSDCLEYSLKIGDVFKTSDTSYEYSFKLNRLPQPDLTGFSKLVVDFTSRVSLW